MKWSPQLCTEDIWQGTMEQITRLGIQPAELPEEALTQIYQVRLSQASSLAYIQACTAAERRPALTSHGDSQSCILKVSIDCSSALMQISLSGRRAFMPDRGLMCRLIC